MTRARRKLGLVAALVAIAVAAWLIAPLAISSAGTQPRSTAATSVHRFTSVPVRGTFGTGGTFVGNMDITKFASSNGQLVAVGSLSGTAKRASGSVVGSVIDRPVQLPLAQAAATCQILHLTLGPLDLNLLGLKIHLNRVVLDITAVRGPGNLLGNLLCAIAHLLDNPPVSNTVMRNLLTAVTKIVGALRLL
jgi:hypothetical protein